MRKFKGFTLVELLVVVAIIGILATVVVISYSGAQKKARDAKVTSDISAVQQALELYYQDKSGYPGWTTGASEAVSGLSDTNITSALTPAYIATIPTPPPAKRIYFTTTQILFEI